MKNKLIDVLGVLMITIAMIFTAVWLTILLAPLLHKIDYPKYGLPLFSLTDEQIASDMHHLCNYLWIWHRQPLVLDHFSMSEGGVIHFADVKRIFDIMQVIWVVCVIGGGWYIFKQKQQQFVTYLKHTALTMVILPTTLGLVAASDFDRFFVAFHKTFFSNDYWIFSITEDPVITILPEQFFMHCFFLIVFLTLIFALGFYLRYKQLLKKAL